MTGSILPFVINLLVLIDSTHKYGLAFRYILRLFPSYSFAETFMNQMTRDVDNKGLWDMDVTGEPLLYMAIECIVYPIIVVLIELILASPDCLSRLSCFNTVRLTDQQKEIEAKADAEEDEDVTNERKRIFAQTNGDAHADSISIRGLRKVYAGNTTSLIPYIVDMSWLASVRA
jgi:hypothetical protein